jgi:Tol biopolymer transport system component/DNA-binding winged helix-turn-helix (wHTH) protein
MAEIPAPARRPIRFSSFELDLHSGELRKAGVLVGLQEQSLKVLVELLERPGDLVTREQLCQRLWPNGTFVDFEHGLNAVINRLREALGDSAESPRFIQTVPRRGYRFIAPVEGGVQPPAAVPEPPTAALKPRKRMWMAVGAAGIVLVVAAIALLRKAPSVETPSPRVVALTRLAGKESGPAFAPDGKQVAFAWSGEKFDNTDIYVTLVGSTSVRRLTTDPADDFAPSWSPDGKRIAFLRKFGNSARIHLTSALGGPDSKLSDFPVGVTEAEGILGAQITWSPDGRHIVAGRDARFSQGVASGLYLIPIEDGEPRVITRPTHPTFDFAPAFSVDGRRLAYLSCGSVGVFLPLLLPDRCAVRMTDVDEAGMPTTAPRTLTTQPVEPSGLAWSRDGTSIVFAMGAPGPVRLWRLWVDPRRAAERIEIAGESVEYPATTPARDRLAFSQMTWDSHLYRFNAGHPVEEVALSSTFETDPQFSPDGRRLAFVSGRSGHVQIWVAAADGSNARQLTHNVRQWPGSPSWSPDGRSIAFDSGAVGEQVRIWTIDADGGTPRQITSGPGNQSVPRWSGDGKWIYFSSDRASTRNIWRVPASGGEPQQVTRTGSGFVAYEFGGGTSLLHQPG